MHSAGGKKSLVIFVDYFGIKLKLPYKEFKYKAALSLQSTLGCISSGKVERYAKVKAAFSERTGWG